MPSGFSADAQWRSVLLHWGMNKELDLAGYTIYRAPSAGDPGTRLNAVPIRDTSYIDNTTQDGVYYYYSVTAVDSSAIESDRTPVVRSRGVSLNRGILIADDQADVLAALRLLLKAEGFAPRPSTHPPPP
jgi:hypothetical protein